jgi:hypothetical protein
VYGIVTELAAVRNETENEGDATEHGSFLVPVVK